MRQDRGREGMNKQTDNNKNMHNLKEIGKYVPEEKWEVFLSELEQDIKDREEESFIEGYCYAIQILQDGLKKKPE